MHEWHAGFLWASRSVASTYKRAEKEANVHVI